MRGQWKRRCKLIWLILLPLGAFQLFLYGRFCGTPMASKAPPEGKQRVFVFEEGERFFLDPVASPTERLPSLPRTPEDLVKDLLPRPMDELDLWTVPKVVHYAWCGNKTFTYVNYLSVLSVWRTLEPDLILIHYEYLPQTDTYNTWLTELRHTIPCLSLRSVAQGSGGNGDNCRLVIALDALYETGGIFVQNDVILMTDSILQYVSSRWTAWVSKSGDLDIFMSWRSNPKTLKLQTLVQTAAEKRTKCNFTEALNTSLSCSTVNDVQAFSETFVYCVRISSESKLFPKDIFRLNTLLGAKLREIAYNTPDAEKLTHTPDTSTLIPKVVHYVWFRKKNMTFTMFLSIMSSLYVIQATAVYVHGDNTLYGPLWEKAKGDSRVREVYRVPPEEIYGHKVLYTQHKSDVLRADILFKYGGIYMDWDAVWLRPVDDIINKGWEFVVNFDHMPRPNYPDVINMGVAMSKPRSRFVGLWRESLVNYQSTLFYHNALELPYKVYERHPDTVYIEPHLQVMCFWLKCHPIFHQDHRIHTEDQPFDWKTDVYAIHFTHPDPPDWISQSAVVNSKSRFADMARHVLWKSKLLSIAGLSDTPLDMPGIGGQT